MIKFVNILIVDAFMFKKRAIHSDFGVNFKPGRV